MNHSHAKHYVLLLVMAALHFAAMYVLMFSMVNTGADFVHNLNFVYMAGLMTAPMIILEIALMRMMYKDWKLNMLAVGVGILMLAGFFLAIRQQDGIGDAAFLRSMIPHHSGAILMCRESSIEDPEIRSLCESIIAGQQQEIDQMRGILNRLPQ
ncbi:MAG TPA: DUF305 domain-containing protein [Candidatus Paceibacterota bacterium]|nr:DUF305 domain-containing protein [Candidatus Paceibacterota bacterium]